MLYDWNWTTWSRDLTLRVVAACASLSDGIIARRSISLSLIVR
jgi:hypothetical protein